MGEAEFYSCDDEEAGKDFSGDIEDDPEMAEMLKMLEDAKGDLEGAPDEDLEQLMQSFDSQDQEKKKSLKRPPATDQQVPEIEKKAKTLDEAILRPVPAFLSGITITPDAEEQGCHLKMMPKLIPCQHLSKVEQHLPKTEDLQLVNEVNPVITITLLTTIIIQNLLRNQMHHQKCLYQVQVYLKRRKS